MCGEGLRVESGTQGWKQQEDSVLWFNEFLLLWALRCSFLPESTGCHHWGQEETQVWNKGCGDITYLHTTIRRQAEQEVTGTKTGVLCREGHRRWENSYILCNMCGDLKNWICEDRKKTRCNSGLTGTLMVEWGVQTNICGDLIFTHKVQISHKKKYLSGSL